MLTACRNSGLLSVTGMVCLFFLPPFLLSFLPLTGAPSLTSVSRGALFWKPMDSVINLALDDSSLDTVLGPLTDQETSPQG